ncbi:hypothetical protein [Hymenobacter algoricola]|uniref:Uncharacterized protein n=1 Tax=Hymenobacter algoricola TaxID=486267 RepID=A0ABP7N269_9BACT
MENFSNAQARTTEVELTNLFEVEELEQRLENGEWVIVIGDTEIPL